MRNLVRLCPLPLESPPLKVLNYSSATTCGTLDLHRADQTYLLLHSNGSLRISEDVALFTL